MSRSLSELRPLAFECTELWQQQGSELRPFGFEIPQSLVLAARRIGEVEFNLNGGHWRLNFISINPTLFLWMLWIVRIATLLILVTAAVAWQLNEQKRAAVTAEQMKRSSALNELASQVAHDIRSPLAALDSVVNRLAQLPEQERVFMRSAINRIKDIANNLLQKNREAEATKKGMRSKRAPTSEPSPPPFVWIVDPLITEKLSFV